MDILSHWCPQPTSLNIQILKTKAVCSLKNDHKILNIMTPPESKAILPHMSSKDHCQQREDSYAVQKAKWTMAEIMKARSLLLYIANSTMVHRTDCKLGFTSIINFDLSYLSILGRELSSPILCPCIQFPKPYQKAFTSSQVQISGSSSYWKNSLPSCLPVQLFGRTGMELVGWLSREKVKSKARKKWVK